MDCCTGNERSKQTVLDDNGTIFCPFLNVYRPTTSSLWKFASELDEKGKLDRKVGLLIGADVTGKQQGIWNAIKGSAPDLYKLDQVPGISHKDLFQKHVDKLEQTADSDGCLTAQNLVDIKKEIAKEVTDSNINKASKVETSLLFLGSGGDLETGKVRLQDIKTFLSGTAVENQGPINLETVNKVDKLISW